MSTPVLTLGQAFTQGAYEIIPPSPNLQEGAWSW